MHKSNFEFGGYDRDGRAQEGYVLVKFLPCWASSQAPEVSSGLSPRASIPLAREKGAVLYCVGHTGLVWKKVTQRPAEARITWCHLGQCPLQASGLLTMADLKRVDYWYKSQLPGTLG